MFKKNKLNLPSLSDAEWNSYSAEQKYGLRQVEADVAREEARRKTIWTSRMTVAVNVVVIGAVLTLVGNVFKTYWDSMSAVDLERERLRSAVIQKGIEPANLDQSQQYWEFLVRNNIINTNR